ncbi:MAG: c-type cytochrome biogenesis protein CcmI [Gammaproteobacteria bacterium]|nr:c-type cytochrome biogenesis protein CcmI [Gammaproteobacteria bacterium]
MSWLGFAGLLVVALLFVVFPLWRRAPRTNRVTLGVASNVAAFRARRQELDEQQGRGEIDTARHRELLAEAELLLVADAGVDSGTNAVPQRSGGAWLLALAGVVVIGVAVAGYVRLGAAPDLALRALLAQDSAVSSPELLTRLKERLVQRPDNTYYRLFLARLELEAGHPEDALAAYRELLQREPDATEVRAEYAQAMFLAADSKITDSVRAEAEQVLARDPGNAIALGLRGISAFQAGDYRAAIVAWNAVIAAAPASPEADAVRGAIAAARARLGEAPPPPLVRIAVTLGAGVPPDIPPDTPVFVFVREWQGPPMPVVARRLRLADLPITLEFDDTASLTPARPLASIGKIEVVARVALGGTPTPSPGDIEGRAGPFERGAETVAVELVIDQIVGAVATSSPGSAPPPAALSPGR